MEITVNGTAYPTWNDVPEDLRTHLGGAVPHGGHTTPPPASVQVAVDGTTYGSWGEVPAEIRALLAAAGPTEGVAPDQPLGDPMAPEEAFLPGSAAPEAFASPTDSPVNRPAWVVVSTLVILVALAIALAISLS